MRRQICRSGVVGRVAPACAALRRGKPCVLETPGHMAHTQPSAISPIGPIRPIRPIPALLPPCALRKVPCQPMGIRFAFFGRHAQGARGETSLFPPCTPFSPVCYMEACGTQCGFFTVRGARTVSRPGGKRCGLVLGATRQPPIFWGLSLHRCAAIPSLGPCALGTEGPRPVC